MNHSCVSDAGYCRQVYASKHLADISIRMSKMHHSFLKICKRDAHLSSPHQQTVSTFIPRLKVNS